jgi:acetylornithine deacetylase
MTLSCPPVREMLEALVGIDTTSSGSNLAAVDLVESWLESVPGVRRQRILDATGQKANLIAWAGPEVDSTREGLIVSGHLDCVPVEAQGWTSDPFVVREQSGRLYGRGVCDMKGFDAIAINAFAQVAPRATRPLVLMLSYDEEVGSHGIARMAEQLEPSVLPQEALIGEPTSGQMVTLHKGHLRFTLNSRGKNAHTAFPQDGLNAIEPLAEAAVLLADLRRAFEQEGGPNADRFPEAPFLVLTVALIEGGSAINVVPDAARLGVGVRVLPGVDPEEVESRVRAHLATLLGENLWMTRDALSPPMPEHADMHLRMLLQSMDVSLAPHGAPFGTDGGMLFEKLGVKSLLWGPGSIQNAHQPDEWIELRDLAQMECDLPLVLGRLVG